jgi:hypothetical protein
MCRYRGHAYHLQSATRARSSQEGLDRAALEDVPISQPHRGEPPGGSNQLVGLRDASVVAPQDFTFSLWLRFYEHDSVAVLPTAAGRHWPLRVVRRHVIRSNQPEFTPPTAIVWLQSGWSRSQISEQTDQFLRVFQGHGHLHFRRP